MDEQSLPSEFPHTVAEAVDWLESVLSDDGLAQLAAREEADLIDLHFGLGAYVRNSLNLWQNEALMADADVADEDGASAVIIEALWRRLRQQAKH